MPKRTNLDIFIEQLRLEVIDDLRKLVVGVFPSVPVTLVVSSLPTMSSNDPNRAEHEAGPDHRIPHVNSLSSSNGNGLTMINA